MNTLEKIKVLGTIGRFVWSITPEQRMRLAAVLTPEQLSMLLEITAAFKGSVEKVRESIRI